MLKITEENKKELPIKHLSPSSVVDFLTDEKSFFTKDILFISEEETNFAMLIGTGFHSGLEYYYNSVIENRKNPKNKIATRQEVINTAINSFKKQVTYKEKQGLQELITRKSRELKKKINEERFFEAYFEILEFDFDLYKSLTEGKIVNKSQLALLKSNLLRAESFFKSCDLELDPDLGYINEEIEEAKRSKIKYGPQSTKETATEQLITGINNYLDNEPKDFIPVSTETAETCKILDFDGEELPIPIKRKTDLVARNKGKDAYDIMIDYKLVTSFGSLGQYEIAVACDYFIGQIINGRKPRKARIIEVKKTPGKPGQGLKKPDLIALCMEHNIPYQSTEITKTGKESIKDDKMEVLISRLLEAGKLEVPEVINIIEVDFEEQVELIQVFIEVYKEILNRFYYIFIEKTLKFLPNPKAEFTGLDSWAMFKYETINEIDPIEDLKEGVSELDKITL